MQERRRIGGELPPRLTERLVIDYESIRKVNARIIYSSILGFGDGGPRREEAAYDSMMQAFSRFCRRLSATRKRTCNAVCRSSRCNR